MTREISVEEEVRLSQLYALDYAMAMSAAMGLSKEQLRSRLDALREEQHLDAFDNWCKGGKHHSDKHSVVIKILMDEIKRRTGE